LAQVVTGGTKAVQAVGEFMRGNDDLYEAFFSFF
jgi:hypothetical protein